MSLCFRAEKSKAYRILVNKSHRLRCPSCAECQLEDDSPTLCPSTETPWIVTGKLKPERSRPLGKHRLNWRVWTVFT
jgi:hypothetical protein